MSGNLGGGASALLSVISQQTRDVRIKTALPDDHLLFHSMRMSEALSTPYQMDMELYSEDPALDPNKLLGHNTTVGLVRNAGGERFFNGYFTSFGFAGARDRKYVYRAVASPWLWFLNLTENCRIFHEKSAVDIIKQIFDEHGMGDYKFETTGSYQTYEYCVQYRESDFNFVSRLLEKEGLYYYFKHENGNHEMVIVDKMSKHPTETGYDSIEFQPFDASTHRRRDCIHEWRQSQNVLTTKVVLQDTDLKQPRADLTTQHSIARQHAAANMAVYQYPGEYSDTDVGTNYAKVRAEEHQTGFDVAQGEANVRGIKSGYRFKLTNHPVKAINKEYLVTAAHHTIVSDEYFTGGGSGQETYSCTFSTMPYEGTFRPPRRAVKPLIVGPQTAVVKNDTDGEEIEPDEYGRVKVMFKWEREGTSSCWVPVSQAVAGSGWGWMNIPRDGHTVIVEFEDGNPDRPLITGRVYTAKAEHPYDPKAKPTITTFKSNSSKGGGGYNELRFDDKKGEENVFIHAEKDMDVYVKDTRKTFIGNEHHEIVEASAFQETGEDKHQTVGGEWRMTVTDNISVRGNADNFYKSGGNTAMTAGGDVHVKAGGKAVIEAPVGLTIKCGGSFVTLSPAGVDIKGPMVNINSGGSANSGGGDQSEKAEAPLKALSDKAGKIADKARGRSYTPTKTELDNHPVAHTRMQAAESGAVFCKKCAELAKAESGSA